MVAYGEPIPVDLDGDGEPDAVLHEPLGRCSGALIDANVFVTAGHCTEEPAVKAAVWFAEDVDAGIPGNGYPFLEFGVAAGEAYAGEVYTHPDYDPAAFYLYDLGVVVLDGAGYDPGKFASLPVEGALDDVGKGRKKAVIEAVGYGLQDIKPVVQADRVRLKADLMLINPQGQGGGAPLPRSITVSGDAKHGGTCFGDSGGPMLIGTDSDIIGAVNSYGLNGNCAGIGGAYRVDLKVELGWIKTFQK
jgi:hypothetical protein